MQETHGLICLPEGKYIGVLNNRAFEALKGLTDTDHFDTKILVPLSQWEDQIRRLEGPGATSKRRAGFTVQADMALIGLRSIAGELARSLGRQELFLQQPHPGVAQYTYSNPQSLCQGQRNEVDGLRDMDPAMRAALAVRGVHGEDEGEAEALDARAGHVELDLDTIFASMSTPIRRRTAVMGKSQGMLSSLFP